MPTQWIFESGSWPPTTTARARRPNSPRRFRVSVSWIGKLLRRRRQTGSIAPKPHSGGRAPAVAGEAADRLRAAVQADPDATLAELRGAVGVACSVPAVHRAPSRLGITRKKS